MPLVMANAMMAPERGRASGGSNRGACMHTTLARCPFVSPSSSTSAVGHTLDL